MTGFEPTFNHLHSTACSRSERNHFLFRLYQIALVLSSYLRALINAMMTDVTNAMAKSSKTWPMWNVPPKREKSNNDKRLKTTLPTSALATKFSSLRHNIIARATATIFKIWFTMGNTLSGKPNNFATSAKSKTPMQLKAKEIAPAFRPAQIVFFVLDIHHSNGTSYAKNRTRMPKKCNKKSPKLPLDFFA